MDRLSKYRRSLIAATRKRLLNVERDDEDQVDDKSIENDSNLYLHDVDDDVSDDETSFSERWESEDTDNESERISEDTDSESESESNSEEEYSDDSIECGSDSESNCDESVLLILEYFLRHNLTKIALDDLLSLVNKLIALGVKEVPRSKYLFNKLLPKVEQPLRHYYCKTCGAYAGEKNQLKSNNIVCENCCEQFNVKSKSKSGLFLQLSVTQQLSRVIPRFIDDLTSTAPSSSDDIYDDVSAGAYYKSIQHTAAPLISLTFNTDGVNIFKSKKSASLWPLLMVVNEIPKNSRFKKENVIVGGLWFGKDPDMSIFLKFFVEEMNQLSSKGLSIAVGSKKMKFNVHAMILAADSPARAKVLNCMMFNGSFGCPSCLHPGNNVKEEAMRYPYIASIQQRSHEMVKEDAIRLLNMTNKKCKDIRGIKGPSPLLLLQKFDMVKGIPTDYMHCCLHGVTAKLLGLWFDKKNHHESYYIGRPNQMDEINKRILLIRLPSLFSRPPRVLEDRSYYKASEFLTFLFYFGAICLDGILPNKYLEHFQLFSCAVYMLNRDNVPGVDLKKAEKLVEKFLSQFAKLYGTENEVFNIHLLTHIIQSYNIILSNIILFDIIHSNIIQLDDIGMKDFGLKDLEKKILYYRVSDCMILNEGRYWTECY
ncbi:hypothetical protein HA402_014397 [Bradysia odoriphaga]|nr:hypothetical protein HA402_014397 [Bradysia odoriphaga]